MFFNNFLQFFIFFIVPAEMPILAGTGWYSQNRPVQSSIFSSTFWRCTSTGFNGWYGIFPQ